MGARECFQMKGSGGIAVASYIKLEYISSKRGRSFIRAKG